MSLDRDRITRPVRRVVTGTRADGKSAVLYDSDNPHRSTRGGGSKSAFNEIWTFDTSPAPLAGDKDWKLYKDAAIVHCQGGSDQEKVEFMFGLFMQRFFLDPACTPLNVVEM